MTEQGAVPDNGIAVERREAQRLYVIGPRTPGPATPSVTWDPGMLGA